MASDLFDSFQGKPERQGYFNNNNASPWAPQQPYIQNLFGQARGIYGQAPFQTVANDPNSLSAQSRGLLGDTISGKYLNSNPYLDGAVNDALGLAKSQFTGQYGGQAGQNVNNSGFQEGLARTLGNTALPFYMNAYNQERGNQLNATQAAPQLDAMQAQAPWMDLAAYQKAIQGNYGGQTAGMQELPWNSQLWNNTNNMAWGPFGFGNGPQMSGGVSQILSDVRAKENIERVGTHDETGVGIYRYNYIGDQTPQIGVLAQELEQVKPEAVTEIDGIKHVIFKMI